MFRCLTGNLEHSGPQHFRPRRRTCLLPTAPMTIFSPGRIPRPQDAAMPSPVRSRKDYTLSRRELLRVGGIGALGLTLPQLLQAEQTGGAASRADACIVIYLNGGPSHLDM